MVLHAFATHPSATPALLRAIAERVALPDDTWTALLANPSTPTDVRDTLTTAMDTSTHLWTTHQLRATLRGDPDNARALAHLTSADERGHWVHELTGRAADDYVTLLHVAERHQDTRHTIVPALLTSTLLPAHLTRACAQMLANDPTPYPAARTWLRTLTDRLSTPDALHIADQLTRNTWASDDGPDITRRVHARPRTYADIIASAHDEHTWLRILFDHADPDGVLSVAAMNACPTEKIFTAVESTWTAPVPVRRNALLHRLRLRTAPSPVHLAELLWANEPPADPQWLAALTQSWPSSSLLRQPNLPGGSLRAAWLLIPDHAAMIATHPNCDADLRADIVASLATKRPEPGDWWVHSAHLPPADAGADAPLLLLRDLDITSPTGPGARVHAALTELLPAISTPEAALALLTLTPTFPGTLREAITAALAVTS